MKLAALISGGKDSLLALHKLREHEFACLITGLSRNKDSYMFHSDAVEFVCLQAESLGIPLITFDTSGVKEEELLDLKSALAYAKKKYGIQGVCSGAVASKYQKDRIDSICKDLSLVSLAPLWHGDASAFLKEISRDFNAVLVKVSADGLGQDWLGRRVDESFIRDVSKLKVHLMGEGGEYESLVLDAPLFRKRLEIKNAEKSWDGSVGHLNITDVVLVTK